ncbi:MAG: alpha-ketoglutarate-dependent dioxygenase AlkB [Moritella sp.]|uniref:alpha-ketoglutarate-dependent dioxygenase AlkB n=1 Tax=Moritella sp. TaxID=78556 RepID=UPI001DF3DC05|nr:alpha-ketoglutarate-dependent dioxygenase AlkB [Moritella sp.]NQZ52538.1 alpha-ketoglutarate-dependent dioxygenase AlkB [Moritella sp.]
MSSSDSSIITVDGNNSTTVKRGKRKRNKSTTKPSLNVLTICNVVDCCKLIKNDICAKLSINDVDSNFTKVNSKKMADCGPYKKSQIADHLLSLIGVVDSIPRSSVQLSSSADTDEHSGLMSDIHQTINEHMRELNKSNEFVLKTIQDQIGHLESLTAEMCTSSKNVSKSTPLESTDISPPKPRPPPSSSNLSLDPYLEFIPEFISEDCCKSLSDYVCSIDDEFEDIGERGTVYVGEHDYHYTGKTHKARKPARQIEDVINVINSKFPDKPVNSCLITKYSDGESFCPPHEDNEDEIAPESNIYTLSIGVKRNMYFHKKDDSQVNKYIGLSERSLMVFSRISQEVWQHSIPRQSDAQSIRYSFTFRMIAPYFVNSTVICGDSNTQKLYFGDSKSTFGKWMPGRQITSYKIEDIPTPYDIGPHKNIVLHVGINNIKFAEPSRIRGTLDTLELKCKSIVDAFPNSNVYICPILPTKDPNMMAMVFDMNRGITELANKYTNLLLMQNYYDLFCDSKGVMKPQLGKFYQGKPNDRDFLHLGGTGIKLLARCIKHSVLRRKGPILKDININNNVNTNIRRQSIGGNRSPQSHNYAWALNHNLR